MIWTIPTIATSSIKGWDSDITNFINSAGISDPTQKLAISFIVQMAKAHGWWTLCSLIYPYVGGSSSTCLVNLKNPGTNNITYHGTLTFATTGVTSNGTTGYGDTGLNINTSLNVNDSHFSVYSRTDNLAFGYEIGAYDNTTSPNTGMAMSLQQNPGTPPTAQEAFIGSRGADVVPAGGGRTDGYFLASRTASNAFAFYRNGTSLGTNTANNTSTNPSLIMFLHCRNLNNGTAGSFTNREQAFITVGAGISSTIQALMYTDIQNFQTILGRQV